MNTFPPCKCITDIWRDLSSVQNLIYGFSSGILHYCPNNTRILHVHHPSHSQPWTENWLANWGHCEAQLNTAHSFSRSLLLVVHLPASEMSWTAHRSRYMLKINSGALSTIKSLLIYLISFRIGASLSPLWKACSASLPHSTGALDECLPLPCWPLPLPLTLQWCSHSPGANPTELLHFSGQCRVGLRTVYSASEHVPLAWLEPHFKLDTCNNRNSFLPSILGCRNTSFNDLGVILFFALQIL